MESSRKNGVRKEMIEKGVSWMKKSICTHKKLPFYYLKLSSFSVSNYKLQVFPFYFLSFFLFSFLTIYCMREMGKRGERTNERLISYI